MEDSDVTSHLQDEKPTWDDDIDTAYADGEQEDEEDYAFDEQEYPDQGQEEEEEDPETPLNMDADFISLAEPAPSKRQKRKEKEKKKKKGKGKEVDDQPDLEEDPEGLTVEEQKEKVKQAFEDYQKLNYEDMASDSHPFICAHSILLTDIDTHKRR